MNVINSDTDEVSANVNIPRGLLLLLMELM